MKWYMPQYIGTVVIYADLQENKYNGWCNKPPDEHML